MAVIFSRSLDFRVRQAGVGSPAALGNQNFTITLTGADPNAGLALLAIDVLLQQPISICGATCGGVNGREKRCGSAAH